MHFQALVAEFLGTFIFVSIILYVINTYPGNVFVPLLIGLALAVAIYLASVASLGSINPAVSLGLYFDRKLTGPEATLYIGAEVLGAIFAFIFYKYMSYKPICENNDCLM